MNTTLKHHIITGIIGICLTLTACHHGLTVYRMDVQQGNVITKKMRRQIHLGMSKQEVEAALGHPVLVDTFNNNRYNYVYSFRRGSGLKDHYKLTVIFRNGEVVRILDGK